MREYNRRHWHKHLFMLHGSVLPSILPRMVLMAVIGAGETWLILFEHCRPFPIAPFTVLGLALGLLLTLRTNASYDRFWEGRKAWGMIVNRSRNLARQWASLVSDETARRQFATWLIDFSEATKRQLNRKPALDPQKMPAQYLNEISAYVTQMRAAGKIDSLDLQRLDTDITCLMDHLGVCERIQKTPIPIAYVLHTRRFLVAYCLSLPLALAEDLRWGTPLVVAFVAYSFLGIERIGIEIEDPFEDTPNDIDLNAITSTISRDVLALLGLKN